MWSGELRLLIQLCVGRAPLALQRRLCTLVVWGEWRLGAGQDIITTTSSSPPELSSFHPARSRPISSHSKSTTQYYYSIMTTNTKYYYSLPTQAPQLQRSGSRRPPLTPSTVSSPCLTTHAPIASRRDSGSGSPTKASALLAKVASHPTSPRGETPTTSPLPSPTTRPAEMHSSPMYSPERPAVWRSESARYVRQYRQHGKHSQQAT
jgi:hypothetical protein